METAGEEAIDDIVDLSVEEVDGNDPEDKEADETSGENTMKSGPAEKSRFGLKINTICDMSHQF